MKNTAVKLIAGVGFYFRNIPNQYFSASGERMRGPSRRVEGKLTSSKPRSGSTLVSPTKSTTSSKPVVPVPILNCSLAASGGAGLLGAIRLTSISLPGLPMQMIPRKARIRIIQCFSTYRAVPNRRAAPGSLGRGRPRHTTYGSCHLDLLIHQLLVVLIAAGQLK